jgi:hypothetical protein
MDIHNQRIEDWIFQAVTAMRYVPCHSINSLQEVLPKAWSLTLVEAASPHHDTSATPHETYDWSVIGNW